MRIVWRDSSSKGHKPVKYRGHYATGYAGGWTIDVEGDNNIYRTHYCALNAIDKHLGGHGQMGGSKRNAYGIQIIGKKNNETA